MSVLLRETSVNQCVSQVTNLSWLFDPLCRICGGNPLTMIGECVCACMCVWASASSRKEEEEVNEADLSHLSSCFRCVRVCVCVCFVSARASALKCIPRKPGNTRLVPGKLESACIYCR